MTMISPEILLGMVALIVSIVGSVFMLIIISVIAFIIVKTNQKHLSNVFEDFSTDTDTKINMLKNLIFTSDGGTNFVRQSECGHKHRDIANLIDTNNFEQKNVNKELGDLKAEIKVFTAMSGEQSNTIQALRLAVVDSTKSQNLIAQELSKLPTMLISNFNGRRKWASFFKSEAD